MSGIQAASVAIPCTAATCVLLAYEFSDRRTRVLLMLRLRKTGGAR